MGLGDPFRVLVVCTGNVARSPVAQRLLVHGLAARTGLSPADLERQVVVASAGTGALTGEPITPQSAKLLRTAGVDPTGHVARQLTDEHLDEADLVLTLTRAHRSAVVARRPLLLRSAFTLREAARLAGDGKALAEGALAERWCSLALQLASARGHVPMVEADDDDVIDPYRRRARVYARAGAAIGAAVDALLDAVAPGRTP